MMSGELEHFKNKYGAFISESRRRYAIPKPFDIMSDKNFDELLEVENGVQIDMSKRDFECLVEMEYWFKKKIQGSLSIGGEAMYICEQHEREIRIRNSNPAAKLAYEKYLTILRMVDRYYD